MQKKLDQVQNLYYYTRRKYKICTLNKEGTYKICTNEHQKSQNTHIMITISPHITDRILVLATAGAARLGMTLDQAVAMSDPFLPAKRKENSAHTQTPPAPAQEPIDGIAAMRALAKQLKQS